MAFSSENSIPVSPPRGCTAVICVYTRCEVKFMTNGGHIGERLKLSQVLLLFPLPTPLLKIVEIALSRVV